MHETFLCPEIDLPMYVLLCFKCPREQRKGSSLSVLLAAKMWLTISLVSLHICVMAVLRIIPLYRGVPFMILSLSLKFHKNLTCLGWVMMGYVHFNLLSLVEVEVEGLRGGWLDLRISQGYSTPLYAFYTLNHFL